MKGNNKLPVWLGFVLVTIGIIGSVYFFIHFLATAGAEFWGGLIFLAVLVIVVVLYENGKK